MKNTQFLQQEKTRVALRSGSRTALVLERDLPIGDTPLARHAKELAGALCDHAERVYLPAAAAQLALRASAGRGYDFTPHRVCFRVSAEKWRGRIRVLLSLHYTVGEEILLAQQAHQVWCASGNYRLK